MPDWGGLFYFSGEIFRLDADDLVFCETVFGATRAGNFESANILHRPRALADSAEALGLSRAVFDQRLRAIRQRLYEIREQRAKPLLDAKHIAEWNGMVIAAMARAATALARADYRDAAIRAADYLWATHHDAANAMLWRTGLHGEAGADGLIVSNHGGRQLDTAVAPLRVLPGIVKTCGATVPVMIDSGFRRGTDILKALALGAKFVFLGRPFNYALACGGRSGVERAIHLLFAEIHRDMALLGVTHIEEVTSDLLFRTNSPR